MTGMTQAKKVLIVEDEEPIRILLREVVRTGGYTAHVSSNGKDGLRDFFAIQPDAVLLDINMPQMDGWTLLERIREVSETPVIFITALGAEADKVKGLKLGADDFMVKPFGAQEVLARIEAVLRRTHEHDQREQSAYHDTALTINFAEHRVFLHGAEVELTPTEFKLVSVLAQNAGRVLTTDRLLDLVWGIDEGDPSSVRLYISYLRKKLADVEVPELIETVRGVGYRYTPPAN